MAKKTPRTKNKDNARRSKKKTSVLVQESVDYIDYKDVNLLRRFMSDRAKIRARRVTGNDAQQQREVARAIKNAREMALLPYANRVTTQRTSRDRGSDRGGADGPPPRPSGPPPTRGAADDIPQDVLGEDVLGDVPEEPTNGSIAPDEAGGTTDGDGE